MNHLIDKSQYLIKYFKLKIVILFSIIILVVNSFYSPLWGIEIGLELEPNMSLPLNYFPEGIPSSIEDKEGRYIFNKPNSVYGLLYNLKPTMGVGMGINVLINQFFIRSAFSIYKFAHKRIVNYSVIKLSGVDMSEDFQGIYLRYVLKNEPHFLDRDIQIQNSMSWAIFRVMGGYRCYIYYGRIKPYIPIAIGPALWNLESDLFVGIAFHTGIGLSINIYKGLDLGFLVKYEWISFFMLDDLIHESSFKNVMGSTSSGQSFLGGIMEVIQTFEFGLVATYLF